MQYRHDASGTWRPSLRFPPPAKGNTEAPCVFGIPSDKWDEQVLRIGETVTHEKPAQHLMAEVRADRTGSRSRSVSTLAMSGAVTARSTKEAKWSIPAASEPVPRKSRSGLLICLRP